MDKTKRIWKRSFILLLSLMIAFSNFSSAVLAEDKNPSTPYNEIIEEEPLTNDSTQKEEPSVTTEPTETAETIIEKPVTEETATPTPTEEIQTKVIQQVSPLDGRFTLSDTSNSTYIIHVPLGTVFDDLQLPIILHGLVNNNYEEININWRSDSDYSSDEVGTIIFNASLEDNYMLGGGVNLPKILVVIDENMENKIQTFSSNSVLDISNGNIELSDEITCPGHEIYGTTEINRIIVKGGSHDITFSGLTIRLSEQHAKPVEIHNGATVNLELAENTVNTLISGWGTDGIGGEGSLIIRGKGSLTAQGIGNTAGIALKNITINGGTIVAKSGGDYGNGLTASETLTINSGIVTADGAKIDGIKAKEVVITGGTVYANNGISGTFTTTANGNAFIVSSSFNPKLSGISDLSGVIFEGDSGKVYGKPQLTDDAVIPNYRNNLIIEGANTLTIPSGVTLTNNGTITIGNGGQLLVNDGEKIINNDIITNNGTLESAGTLRNIKEIYINESGEFKSQGDVVNEGNIYVSGTLEVDKLRWKNLNNGETYECLENKISTQLDSNQYIAYSTIGYTFGDLTVQGGTIVKDYIYFDHVLTVKNTTEITISGKTENDRIVVETGNPTITFSGLTIRLSEQYAKPVEIHNGATVNLELAENTVNTLISGWGTDGIGGEGTLTIGGKGSLTTKGTGSTAGISLKNITIDGGTIVAKSGDDYGSGINASETLTINSGIVTVKGVKIEGIKARNVVITGGTVYANNGINGTFTTTANGNAFIVSSSFNPKLSGISDLSGVIFEGDSGKVYGKPQLTDDAVIPYSWNNLIIEGANTLTIPSGVTLTNNGTITIDNGGELLVEAGGSLISNGIITNNGSITIDNGGELLVEAGGSLINNGIITNNGTLENSGTIENKGTISGSSITGTGNVVVDSQVVVTFMDNESTITTIEHGKKLTLVATITEKTRSNTLGTVKFYLGSSKDGKLLGTANVEKNIATFEVTLSDQAWSDNGWVIGNNTITAQFSGGSTFFANEGNAMITVNKSTPIAPVVTFSFDGNNANKLMGSTSLMQYSIDNGNTYTNCTANTDLSSALGSITVGNDIKIRLKETDTENASSIKTIDITKGELVSGIYVENCSTPADNDGKLIGVSTGMEYQIPNSTDWIQGNSNTITGLKNGEYKVRNRAQGTVLAGDVTTFEILEYAPKLISISVKNKPKEVYFAGDMFDPTGLELTLSYDKGSSKEVTYSESTKNQFSFSLTEALTTSNTKIEISYTEDGSTEGCTSNVDIKVYPNYKNIIETEQTDFYVTNETTAEEVLELINNKINNGDVNVSWKLQDSFNKVDATGETNGSISGTVIIKIDKLENREIVINLVIAQLIQQYEDTKSGVTIKGVIEPIAIFEVKDITGLDSYNVLVSTMNLNDYDVVKAWDITLINGSYKDELAITFELGDNNNGKTVVIKHQKKDNSSESFETICQNGKVSIIVDELSPYVVFVEKEKVINPPTTPVEPTVISTPIPTPTTKPTKKKTTSVVTPSPVIEVPNETSKPTDVETPVPTSSSGNLVEEPQEKEALNPFSLILIAILLIVGVGTVVFINQKKKDE